ncbi:hypothetical protein C8R43DRAFT_368562 [Mycena crocata]|nr:hypothetical protein C8R43DRAFT_368562 [Mycena crocata]
MGTNKDITSDTKKLVVHLYYNRGRKQADIASDLLISLSSVEKILGRYRRDTEGLHVPPTLRVPGRRRILQTVDVDLLIGLIERTPDMYLYEMQQELLQLCNINVSLHVIWRALRRRGYTRKRVSRVAAQRDEQARANFQIYMALTYRADQLVFVDEAACNRATTKRGWAWAREGERARRHDIYIRGINLFLGIRFFPPSLWMGCYISTCSLGHTKHRISIALSTACLTI